MPGRRRATHPRLPARRSHARHGDVRFEIRTAFWGCTQRTRDRIGRRTAPGIEEDPIGRGDNGPEREVDRRPEAGPPTKRTEDDLSDAALVLRVRADAPEALAALYRRHGPMVYHVAYRFLASEQDAQDVLQDVFAGLPEALRTYEERNRFPYWLKRLAVRAALMALRARDRRREDRLPDPASYASKTHDPAPVTDYVATRRAIARLSDEQRVVLMLKQVEGYTHAEIGALLGISEGASAARLHRALKRLWELLGEPGGEG